MVGCHGYDTCEELLRRDVQLVPRVDWMETKSFPITSSQVIATQITHKEAGKIKRI